MTMTALDPNSVSQYLTLAAAGDTTGARRMVLGLLDRGVPYSAVIDLLAAAQHEVGQRWQDDQWTVADEHVVSGVTQRCLDVVASIADADEGAAHVVAACAEGDWHSLPAQMFSELLRSRGIEVTDLGGSIPAAHVAEFLDRRHVDALVITCSMPLYFAGVTALAVAAHARGIPVLAGGRAFAGNPQRATALGADAWTDTLDSAVEIIHGWYSGETTPALADVTLNPDALHLHAAAGEIAAEAFTTLQRRLPVMRDYSPDQRTRTLEDLVYITEFTAAARLLNDPPVVEEFIAWLTTVLHRRGVPVAAVRAGAEALAPIIARSDPLSARLLSDSLKAAVVPEAALPSQTNDVQGPPVRRQ